MLFVWNGKSAGASVKSQTLTKGYALDEYLQQAKDSGLNVLFSGGVVKNKKLQRGNIYIFGDVIDQQKMLKKQTGGNQGKKTNDTSGEPNTDQIVKAYESVYLLKWLFPDTTVQRYREKLQEINHGNYPKFHANFLTKDDSESASTRPASSTYWSRFQIIDDVDDIDTEAEDFPNEESEDENLDIDMKDMDTNIKRPDGYDEEMLNDEIEDIESDEDNAQIYAYQQMEQERRGAPEAKKFVVPGLSLGGI